MGIIQLPIDRETNELMSPCGCRFPNSFDGMMQARVHLQGKCDAEGEG